MEKDIRSFIHFMQQTVPFDLKDRITAALTDSRSELWLPHLTYDLMQNGLQKLYDETEIAEADYGTAAVILKDANAQRLIEGAIFTRNDLGEIKNETFIEMLPANIIEEYKESGVNFYTREELRINNEITNCLRDAFEIIRHVPSLFSTVRHLVKSIHLIKPEDNEYDVSFSEPHIPFSVFVSIPQRNDSITVLRVTEAITHEAMHLQLTFIEKIVPLVIESGNFYFSPWKSEFRNIVGILHALYVFRVIYNFNGQLARCLSSEKCKWYLTERQNLISQEVTKVNKMDLFPDLTQIGKAFVSRLTANQG